MRPRRSRLRQISVATGVLGELLVEGIGEHRCGAVEQHTYWRHPQHGRMEVGADDEP